MPEKIKLTFLGTGNAIPTEKRNHTAILLSYKNENILIDCGEGTQRQFRFAKISPMKLTKILITHWHGDHVLGLPGLFQTLVMNEYQKIIEIYGPKSTREFISQLKHVFNLKINANIFEAHGAFFKNKDFILEAATMSHGIPALAYAFIIPEKTRLDKEKIKKLKLPNSPLLGKLQQGYDVIHEGKKIKSSQVTYTEKGKKISVILDTAMNKNAVEIAKNADLLVCEASFTEAEKAQAADHLHLTAADAATIAKKAKVKKLILTHISQRYEHAPEIIEKEAKKIFKNVKLAKDFDVFEV